MKTFLLVALLSLPAYAAKPIELPKISHAVQEQKVLISATEAVAFHEITKPGASFVKVHFEKFNIPKGVIVRVRNPEGTEVYDYARKKKGPHTKGRKDDGKHSFSAMSVSGDTAIVEVLGYKASPHSLGNRLKIDFYTAGLPQEQITEMYSGIGFGGNPESTCGALDRVPTPCIQTTYPAEYDRMRPVARINNGSGSLCTAWRVGENNRLLTNEHCNNSQADIAAAEVWFYYEYTSCSWQASKTVPIKVAGDQLLAVSHAYDMALFTVKDFERTEPFGYLGLEIREPVLRERIYRGGHGGGLPKQATIESDRNSGGFCQVDDVSMNGYATDSDMGYWCDSEGGSSGSPVMLRDGSRVIGLHHFGGCLNGAVKVSKIWPRISEHFGGVIPNGDDDTTGDRIPPVVNMQMDCVFGSCTYDSSGSTDADGEVTYHKWDFGDGTIVEAASGTHVYDTTGLYTVSLVVRDNDGNPAFDSRTLPVTLEGGNIPPVPQWSVTDDGNYTGFFKNLSYDWDDEIVESCWRYKDSSFDYGPRICSPGIADGQHTFQIGGAQVALLTVTDAFGDSKSAAKWVTINGPVMNRNPVSSMIVTKIANDTYRFTDTSTDSDGEIVRWIYWPGESPVLNGQGPHTKTYILPDGVSEKDYDAYLWAYDNHGVPDISKHHIITVTAPLANQPPVAGFRFDAVLREVSFTDTSTDDSEVVSWSWDFGDGDTSTERNPTHTYPDVDNTYSVMLTVADGEGLSDSTVRTVAIDPDPPPVLTFTTKKNWGSRFTLELNWGGLDGPVATILRDNRGIADVADTTYSLDVRRKHKGDRFKVCDSDQCTNTITLRF